MKPNMGPRPEDSDPGELEGLVEECLQRLVEDGELDLEPYRQRVPAARWPWFEGRVRSAEYRWRRAQGEDVRADAFLDRLGEGARNAFLEALAASRLGAAFLPLRIVPGTLIRGRYLILNPLGEGGQASVFAAWDRELQVEVALKFLLGGDENAGGEWEAIVRGESQLLARLKSRNIVRVYDVVREGERSFLVMDLVPGLDLKKALQELRAGGKVGRDRVRALMDLVGRRPQGEHQLCLDARSWPRTAARIAVVIARTIALVHDKNVVHRDLKPANVMIVAGGEPVLLDFGLGSRSGGRVEGFRCTPGYIAPEQAREASSGTNPLTDVYQIGLILYELLTLRQVYPVPPDATVDTIIRQAARAAVVPPRSLEPDLPPELEAICLKALAPEKDSRYSNAAELATDLERFARGLPPRGVAIPRLRSLRMRARYAALHPAGLTAALAMMALASSPLVFGKDEWEAPVAVPLLTQANLGTENDRILVPGESLEVGDRALLAIDVVCPDPAYLYAFSLYGSGGYEGLYLKPVAPEFLPFSEEHPTQSIPEPLRLEAGRHRVACASLKSPARLEGLMLLFSQQPSTLLGEWRTTLSRRIDELDPLRYPEALELARSLAENPRKGDSPSSLSPEERRAFSRIVSDSAPELLLTIDGMLRIDWVFPVTRQAVELR